MLILLFSIFLFPTLAVATDKKIEQNLKGKVTAILEDTERSIAGKPSPYQKVEIQLLDKRENNKRIQVTFGENNPLTKGQKVRVGETVLLTRTSNANNQTYSITDKYRLTPLIIVVIFFFLFVSVLAGKKGIGAVLGMFISLGVIVLFIVPQILSGSDPLFISIIGCLGIMVTTIYLAHGISQQTTVAVTATAISLVLTGICGGLFISLMHLAGLGAEDIFTLQQSVGNSINYQGLLLGGIIIGALGALDDVTTTQSATIYTLAKADPKATFETLVKHGLTIGKEHIASLVNTLVLAYAGASIGIFFFLVISQQNHSQPLWVILNSETIVEEVVRTIAGSIGLILAVPLTTVIAAFFSKYDLKIN